MDNNTTLINHLRTFIENQLKNCDDCKYLIEDLKNRCEQVIISNLLTYIYQVVGMPDPDPDIYNMVCNLLEEFVDNDEINQVVYLALAECLDVLENPIVDEEEIVHTN